MTNNIKQRYKNAHNISDDDLDSLYMSVASQYNDSLQMTDITNATDVLKRHTESNIIIVADYDTDGVMSGLAFKIALEELFEGASINLYYPSTTTGYGMTVESISEAIELFDKPDLVITCDNGINAKDAVDYLRNNYANTDILITDHHLGMIDKLPTANAIVCPNRVDKHETYPFKEISGTVVVYKVIDAYIKLHSPTTKYILKPMSVLAGISVISDVMPLENENITFVKDAIECLNSYNSCKAEFDKAINNTASIIISQIMRLNNFQQFTMYTLGFVISPIINSARRMEGSSKLAFEALLGDNESLDYLIDMNNNRKAFVKSLLDKVATNQIEHFYKMPNIIIIQDDSITHTVAGLVASSVVNDYKRPAIVLGKDGKGSGRSTESVNLFESLKAAENEDNSYFTTFGGHAGAIGCSIAGDYYKFAELCNKHTPASVNTKDYSTAIDLSIDDILSDDMDGFIVDESLRLHTKKCPKLLIRVTIPVKHINIKLLKNTHAKLTICNENGFECIKWNDIMSDLQDKIDSGYRGNVTIIGTISKNYFGNKETTQLIIQDYS